MEIEISGNGQQRILLSGLALLLLLAGLGVLGRFVTPVEAGQPVLLSPDRWQAAHLARRARAETAALHRDAEKLLGLLDAAAPDPVSAMLLAQGVYARHRTGTSATAAARQALITAAEAAARYAAGTMDASEVVAAVEAALRRLEPLLEPSANSRQPSGQAGPGQGPGETPFRRMRLSLQADRPLEPLDQTWLVFLPLVSQGRSLMQASGASG